jgi:hypothetical protein
METTIPERLCVNEACACRPVPSRLFCCSLCAAATLQGLKPAEDCSCGHAECASGPAGVWTPALVTVRG